jgi:hypothetical protein
MTFSHLFVYCCNPVYVWDGISGCHDMRGPMYIASKSATFSEPDRTRLGAGNMRSNYVHRRLPLSDSPLMFEFSLTVYPASIKPKAGTCPSPSFIPQIWHPSVQGPNPVLQPWELLRLVRNIRSLSSPFFKGEAIVMISRQLFVYHCNPVYIWDRTSGNHDRRGPVSIASKSATFS